MSPFPQGFNKSIVISLLLPLAFLIGCSAGKSNEHPEEISSSNLAGIDSVETGSNKYDTVIYNGSVDFVMGDINRHYLDKHKTEWSEPLSGQYRFVIKNGNFLVYRNKTLINEYNNCIGYSINRGSKFEDMLTGNKWLRFYLNGNKLALNILYRDSDEGVITYYIDAGNYIVGEFVGQDKYIQSPKLTR
ncbi:hypothetical protein [Parachryseolinea silvisoli]|uniref:hypothetical protein n=1 Tax=Parachryseolinea silvisoli TaxID=2873601 RepID=UPI0022659ADF|nr:hypothetical protein [Parachryseolinea silvisoli]MCD9019127.1 hypothetical protein [Parachryseolinea silvisoli]